MNIQISNFLCSGHATINNWWNGSRSYDILQETGRWNLQEGRKSILSCNGVDSMPSLLCNPLFRHPIHPWKPTLSTPPSLWELRVVTWTIFLFLYSPWPHSSAKWQERQFWLATKFQHNAIRENQKDKGSDLSILRSLLEMVVLEVVTESLSIRDLVAYHHYKEFLPTSSCPYHDCAIMEAWLSFHDLQDMHPCNNFFTNSP